MVLFKNGDDFHRFIHPIWKFCNRSQAIEAKLNAKEPCPDTFTFEKSIIKTSFYLNGRRFFYGFKLAVRLAQRCCKNEHVKYKNQQY